MIDGAHLVGSVPLADAETVLRTVSQALGDRLERIPDGETGRRKDWIAWQYAVLAGTPGLRPIEPGQRGYLRPQLVGRVDPGSPPPAFGPLGYADAAVASFDLFERLQREGAVPARLRFQVSLPTPLAPVTVFVAPGDRASVEPPYQARLLEELRQIASAIPHHRLAVQWDVAVEVGLLEGVWPAHFPDVESGVLERLGRLAAAVPAQAQLGFHLCYGDFGHRHFTSPADAGTLVRLANAIAGGPRAPDWIHLPVPLGWASPAPYAPLAGLALAATTRLHLGLIHLSDGLEGARRRVALAGAHLARFGVATECGWGRRPPAEVPALLELHAALARGG